MAEVEPQETTRRRRRVREEDGQHRPPQRNPSDRPSVDGNGRGDAVGAAAAARMAAEQVEAFTGRDPESVISIERREDDWLVGVEVVETHRIPDTADVLASYEVRLDRTGALLSYRRTHRYARGRLNRECR